MSVGWMVVLFIAGGTFFVVMVRDLARQKRGEKQELFEVQEFRSAHAESGDDFDIDAELARFDENQKLKPIYDKHFETYITAYNEAEVLRKAGDGAGAIPFYEKAIEHIQKAQPPGEEFLPPAPFTALATMFYHMGQDERAVAVLDIYSEYEKRHGNKVDAGIKAFRKRLATGDFRRLRNKYNK